MSHWPEMTDGGDNDATVERLAVRRYHSLSSCDGHYCPVHNPSPHHMRNWPITVRETGLVERVCEHGVGHPDPDSVVWMEDNAGEGCKGTWGVHGCDGCCRDNREIR